MNRIAPILAVVCGIIFFSHECYQLFTEKWPLHYDSFYYLVEFRSAIQTGLAHYDPNLPFFVVMGKLGSILGLDEGQLYRWTIVLSFLVFCGAVTSLVWKRSAPLAFGLLLYLMLASQNLFVTHYAYLKQASGMAALAIVIALSRRERPSRIALGIFVILAAIFHKFSGALAVIFLTVTFLRTSAKWSKNRLALFAILGLAALLFGYILGQAAPDLRGNFGWSWPPRWYTVNAHVRPLGRFELLLQLAFGVAFLVLFAREKKFSAATLFMVLFILLMIPTWGAATLRLGWYSSGWIFFLGVACGLRALPEKNHWGTTLLIAMVFLRGYAGAFVPKSADLSGYTVDPSTLEAHKEALKRWIPPDAHIHSVFVNYGDHYLFRYFLDRKSGLVLPEPVTTPLLFYTDRSAFPHRCQSLEELPRGNVKCVSLSPTMVLFQP